ncbi:MAG: PAS domain S-box protein [Lachnospiraceae bacterium]|nr:PAS domain S-box protein [Lachnospiraceae bacterium]
MKNRIFRNTMLVMFFVVALCGVLILGVLYDHFTDELQDELINEATYITQGVEANGVDYLNQLEKIDTRITWVDTDGTVLYDNKVDVSTMENHGDRQEIKVAMTSSKGKSIRYSNTLAEKTIYYAVRIADGSVIRVSNTQSSVVQILKEMLRPVIVVLLMAFALAGVLAYRVAKQIMAPLDNIDFEHPEDAKVYDEMAPFISKIIRQNKQIKANMDVLQSQQQEFRLITENMQEGFIVIDKTAHILSYNSSALKLFGVNMEVENKSVLVLNRTDQFGKLVNDSLQGKHMEEIILLGDRYCNVYINPVMDKESVAGAIMILTDVTEKEERENLRREFSANVSHELKTPLTSISGIAEIIKNGIVDEKDIPKFAGNIYEEAKRLISLVEDIIKISRMDEMEGIPEKQPVDLCVVAQKTIENLRQTAVNKDIKIKQKGDSCQISGVEVILYEMIYNICDNAIKYNKQGGNVIVETGYEDEHAYIKVSDTGIGIPEEQLDRIFERFYRVDKSHSKNVGGTGLGLSIVKHGARLHNATIDISSALSKGTTITIRFGE